MITPSRWMTKQGQGVPDSWVDEMLNGNHLTVIHDYIDASECFSGVEIKGGVSYFLYSPEFIGKCLYTLHNGNEVHEKDDYLNASGMGIVIRDPMANEILEKISAVEGDYLEKKSFSSVVGPLDLFDKKINGIGVLTTNWTGYVKQKDDEHNIKFYLNRKLDPAGFGWIKYSDIPKGHASIPVHKVYIPKAGGSGNDPIVLGKPFYGEPNSVCSQTYICIGYDPQLHNFTKEQCESIISYIRTCFFRYIVSIKKKTQDTSRDVFQFVPIQEWSKQWTDAELYAKYHLSPTQISFIESRVKPLASDTLFDSESLLDPEFGNFILKDYGAEPGDVLTYTPADIEVTVLEDNKVAYGDEEYSLSEFTAKHMPRNKRSISGVCQGPKYFSKGGVSLYKLKESFLGGKK